MEISLLLIVIGLFIAVLVIKSVVSLAVRYALFVAVALFVATHEYGPDVMGWLDGYRAAKIGMAAGLGLIGTKLVSLVALRNNRWRYVLVPAIGIVLTAVITRTTFG